MCAAYIQRASELEWGRGALCSEGNRCAGISSYTLIRSLSRSTFERAKHLYSVCSVEPVSLHPNLEWAPGDCPPSNYHLSLALLLLALSIHDTCVHGSRLAAPHCTALTLRTQKKSWALSPCGKESHFHPLLPSLFLFCVGGSDRSTYQGTFTISISCDC